MYLSVELFVRIIIYYYKYIKLSKFIIFIHLYSYNTVKYCKRTNIRGGFNFAMVAVDDFSAKLNQRDHFTTLLSIVIS